MTVVGHRTPFLEAIGFLNRPITSLFNLTFFIFTDQQFLLKRLADAAIDIYGMAAVLSR